MKTISQTIIKTTIVSLMIFSMFTLAYAQTDNGYTPLAPLPGIGEGGTKTTLSSYLPAVFNLSIGIAAVMAFVVITFGGIVYATSDAIQGKEDGKRWVTNAVWGLLLVIGAYAILYTINPKILEFNLSLKRPPIAVGIPTAEVGVPMTPDALADHERVKSQLVGIDVNAPPCTIGQVSGCTNLNGLPSNAINGLKRLKIDCGGCDMMITGGTEGGHVTHGAGAPIVDLRKDGDLGNYINSNKVGPPVQTNLGPLYTLRVNGRAATFLDEGDHWHVVFN